MKLRYGLDLRFVAVLNYALVWLAAPGVFSMQHRLLPEEGLPARLLA
jgi:hypothetical protein